MTAKVHFISIILPVRNEVNFIEKCLQSIFSQDYPKDKFEVLIVDGMSYDGTLEKISEWKNKELNIKIFENWKKVVSSARNIAIKNATGDIVLCMDAHAFYAPDYISSCLKVMEETGAANVGGHARALPPSGRALALASMFATDSPFGLGGARFRDPSSEGYVETVWLGCYQKKVFDDVGVYDERRTRTEDIDLNSRLLKGGYKIYLSSKIKAWYYPRSTVAAIWRQRWADGYEITRFLPDNPKAPRLRHFIPLIFVVSLTLLAATAIFYQPETSTSVWTNLLKLDRWNIKLTALRLLFLELLAYFCAMGYFTLKEYSQQPTINNQQRTTNNEPDKNQTANGKFWISYLLLPIVFITMHFSYGFGSLWGLITLPFWVIKGQKGNY
jgi:glycosyltransferase involved in cell wall biosynthesis